MTYCTLTTVQASALFRHASIMRDALMALPMLDDDHMPLDLGTEQALEEAMAERSVHLQAIDEHMADRADLKARIAHLEGITASQARALTTLLSAGTQPPTVSILGAENAKLRADVKALEDATIQAANFIGALRAELAQAGVTFDTDELDMPVLTIDANELCDFLYAAKQANRTQAAAH